MHPTVNKVIARSKTGLRPKTCEKETKLGCHTVEARRKEVPTQKAWIEVPLRAVVITFGNHQ